MIFLFEPKVTLSIFRLKRVAKNMSLRRKLKMLAWCDSPLSITGFGVVAKNILGRIYDTGRFDIACVGINHMDEHVEKAWSSREGDVPYRVFIGQDFQQAPGGGIAPLDPMGRMKAIRLITQGDCDVVFMMRDLWDFTVAQIPGGPWLGSYFPLHLQLAKEHGRNFRTLVHFPLEYDLQDPWKSMLDQIDYGMCFTQNGLKQLSNWPNIAYCPQGADAKIFKQLPKRGWGPAVVLEPVSGGYRPTQTFIKDTIDFRRRKMHLQDPENCFIVLNVNRNQPRKDIPATLKAFRRFLEFLGEPESGAKRPVLWLQMRPDDQFGDVRKAVEAEGLIIGKDVLFPPYFNVGVGWSDTELNMLYNAVDVFISTSVAEGFGLTPVEAGMAGCPVLVPGHTGHLDTMHHLGMPYVKCLEPEIRPDVAATTIHPTDTEDMAQQLLQHYRNPPILKSAIEKNIDGFRRQFDWDNIFARYWEPALKTIETDIFGTPDRQKVNAQRALYVCDEAFGDVLGATKAIHGLKQANPNVPIDFMTKRQFQDVVTNNPNVDRILPWDLNKLFDYQSGQVFYPHARIRHGAWATGFTHLMAMQAEMIGVRPGPAFIDDEPFNPGIPGVPLTADAEKDVVFPIITVHATSQGGKMITPDKWAAAIAQIQTRFPQIRFVLVGGPQDIPIPGTVDRRLDSTTGKPLSYRRMAWLQRHAFCHIGIDSGPAHCASVMGTPSLVVWGWTDVQTCCPEHFSINLVPHYPSVCPRMGPCHGVSPACKINQYDRNSAMQAPCAKSINLQPMTDLILEALNKGLMEGKEWLKDRSAKIKQIYSIPPLPVLSQAV